MIYLILRMSSGGTHTLVTAPWQRVRSPSAGTAKGPPPSQRTGLFILIWHKVQGLKGNFFFPPPKRTELIPVPQGGNIASELAASCKAQRQTETSYLLSYFKYALLDDLKLSGKKGIVLIFTIFMFSKHVI